MFFDQDPKKNDQIIDEIRVVWALSEVKVRSLDSNLFCIVAGNPDLRKSLPDLSESQGGVLQPIVADSSFVSHTAERQIHASPSSL